jgi:hypothetical protein
MLCLPACQTETIGPPTSGSKDCTPLFELSPISGGTREGRGVAVSGGIVYSMRPPEVLASQVFEIDPIRLTEREVTRAGEIGLLHDAADGAVLVSTGETMESLSLIHIDDRGERRVIDASAPPFTDPDPDLQGRAHMLVDRTGAAWRTDDGVFRWDVETSSTQTFAARDGAAGQPSRSGPRVGWTVRRAGGAALLVSDRDVATTTIAVGDVSSPAVSGSIVFYLEGRRLVRHDLETAMKATLHEGPCAAPFADGDRAVAACGGGTDAIPPGEVLVYWDGAQAHELFEDGHHHHAPRLDEGIIAWIRYDSPDTLCMPPREGAGEVVMWDPDATEEPNGRALIAAPCLCCGANAAPAELAFEQGVLAYNYASTDGSPHRIGFTVVERRRMCE